MNKKGVLAVVGALVVVAFAVGVPHLPGWVDSAKPAVLSKSPGSSHPEDRDQDAPGEVRPLDRQKVNVATESIAVPREIADSGRNVWKAAEGVQLPELPSRNLPSFALEEAYSRLLIPGLILILVAASLILVRRQRRSL